MFSDSLFHSRKWKMLISSTCKGNIKVFTSFPSFSLWGFWKISKYCHLWVRFANIISLLYLLWLCCYLCWKQPCTLPGCSLSYPWTYTAKHEYYIVIAGFLPFQSRKGRKVILYSCFPIALVMFSNYLIYIFVYLYFFCFSSELSEAGCMLVLLTVVTYSTFRPLVNIY